MRKATKLVDEDVQLAPRITLLIRPDQVKINTRAVIEFTHNTTAYAETYLLNRFVTEVKGRYRAQVEFY